MVLKHDDPVLKTKKDKETDLALFTTKLQF